MPLVGDRRICCQFYDSAALDYDERLTIIVPHICARFFRTRLDSLSLPICARQAVGVQFERRCAIWKRGELDLESFWDILASLRMFWRLSLAVICPWWGIGGSAVNFTFHNLSAPLDYDDWQATLLPSIHSKSPTQVEAYGLPGQDLPSRLRRGNSICALELDWYTLPSPNIPSDYPVALLLDGVIVFQCRMYFSFPTILQSQSTMSWPACQISAAERALFNPSRIQRQWPTPPPAPQSAQASHSNDVPSQASHSDATSPTPLPVSNSNATPLQLSQPNATPAASLQSSGPVNIPTLLHPDSQPDDLARARTAYLDERKSKSFLAQQFAADVLLHLADEFEVGPILTRSGKPSQNRQLIANALVLKRDTSSLDTDMPQLPSANPDPVVSSTRAEDPGAANGADAQKLYRSATKAKIDRLRRPELEAVWSVAASLIAANKARKKFLNLSRKTAENDWNKGDDDYNSDASLGALKEAIHTYRLALGDVTEDGQPTRPSNVGNQFSRKKAAVLGKNTLGSGQEDMFKLGMPS
ncbi:hypothetical protein BT96DRAFT_1007443 [Gymnopus androsaceus JB14]|uniref:Uncharacterized protein n=1 Tax=Gymnopus androsaceus JB14 TaxID=1447944 RepID=A0A6A4GHX2_9AGAR|nr:hypothetical protein BT96DRAFT_1007443 [Gymnopus androsaceus JB14]